jgi:hypothetical protein
MKDLRTNWQKKHIIFLVAVTVDYLLFFLFYYLTYYPSGCGLYIGGNFGDAIMSFGNSGRSQCALVSAGVMITEPLSIFYDTPNLFYVIGLMFWAIETFVYALVFFSVYILIQFIRKKGESHPH